MYFIFSVFPVTLFIKKGHVEYAYQSASCDFWNISIHQFCIERTCKNKSSFFYLWLVIAYSYKRYRTTSLNEIKRIDKSHNRLKSHAAFFGFFFQNLYLGTLFKMLIIYRTPFLAIIRLLWKRRGYTVLSLSVCLSVPL